MMPSARSENRSSAPPENMLNMSRMPPRCERNSSASFSGSIPGTGMNVPMRYTIRAPSRNSRRRFKSPILPMPSSELVAATIPVPLLALRPLARGHAAGRVALALRPGNRLRGRGQLHAAAGGFDRRARTLGNEQALQRHLALDLAREDDLGAQRRLRHHPGGLERG